MGKTVELELNWWEITFWPGPDKYEAEIHWKKDGVTTSEENSFRTFEKAKAWIDEELAK